MHCPTTLLTPKKLDNSHRHKIFWTLCTIRNKVCNVIIDGGSSENFQGFGEDTKFEN